jgi:hypothetical protein
MMSLKNELTDKSVSRFKIGNGDRLYRMYVRYLSQVKYFIVNPLPPQMREMLGELITAYAKLMPVETTAHQAVLHII